VATPKTPSARPRWLYAGAVVATIAAGLASRRYAAHLPGWLAKNLGDALYATMMYWLLAVIAPRAQTSRLALAATAVCFAIELSQRYQAPWIDAIRATLPGRLILGQGFHALDLACYVAGVALAVILELMARRVMTRRAGDRAHRPRAAAPE
jgi:hypothetical protein